MEKRRVFLLSVHVRACTLLLYWSKEAESVLLLLPESVSTQVAERLLETVLPW